MADKQIHKIRWEDGRFAERHIQDWHPADDGGEQREVELFVEPERQLNLKQRVIERRKPVVYHRTTQVIDGEKIVEQTVEERDEDKLQIVEHIGLANPGSAAPSQPSECEQLAGEVRNLVAAINQNQVQQNTAAPSVAPRRIRRSELAEDAQPPLQDTVAGRLQGSNALVVINAGLSVVIAGLLVGIGYFLVFAS